MSEVFKALRFLEIDYYLSDEEEALSLIKKHKGAKRSNARAGEYTRHARNNENDAINSVKDVGKNDDFTQSRAIADACHTLADLRCAVHAFSLCDLKFSATNTVFADGNPEAQVMLIGEAPGAQEDLQGIPFCGESGKLLDNIMLSIELSRSELYITNSVFWRPPANRTPTEDEIEVCRPLVEKHIALIAPKLIILVGNTAVASVLGRNYSVSKMRSKFFEYNNIYLARPIHITAIFHPAYLLRQPKQKQGVWYDMIKIDKFIKNHIVN
ncbi:uracil-DNA glycosylase [Candidatus Sarmatiella mevalonica]|uniref:uracil-DNA glycosylase n=1 Tax=Candidatus Sarmatiella mevalonica TaxID=2770581 RepID=UPI003977E453